MSKRKEEKYGWWECPECKDICQDPERVRSTVCHNEHPVSLSDIYDDGHREAYLKKDLESANARN